MAKGKAKKTTAKRLEDLKGSYNTLREAMPVIGETDAIPNGLGSLADRVKSATVLNDDAIGTVSASGSVYKGDMVTLTKELNKLGDKIRIANGDATMLGATSVGDTVVIVFAQDDDTYIKAARWAGNDWTLGPTQTFVEGPLDKVILVPYGGAPNESTYYLAAFYQEDDVGMVQFWANEWPNLTYYGTDIWLDEPMNNLCGAWTPSATVDTSGFGKTYTNALTMAGLNKDGKIAVVRIEPQWNWNQAENKSYISAYIRANKVIEPGPYIGISIYANETENKMDDFTIPEPDKEIYGSAAWNLICNPSMGGMLLVFPGADGKRYILDLWLVDYDRSQTPVTTHIYSPAGCAPMLLSDQLPCGSGIGMIGGETRLNRTSPIIAAGVSRIAGNGIKSSIGIEQWTSGYGWKFLPFYFGEESQTYNKNVGLISLCYCSQDKEVIAVGYCAEGKYRSFLMYNRVNSTDFMGGPNIELADVDTAAALVESGNGSALVWEKSNSIFLQQFISKDVVISTDKGYAADGVAVTGGRAGQDIQIRSI